MAARHRPYPGDIESSEEEPRDRFHGQGIGYQAMAGRDRHLHPSEVEELTGMTNTELMEDLRTVFPPEILDRMQAQSDGNLSPSQTVRLARGYHGEQYAMEYALRTLHRLLLRNVPVDRIAMMFDVSVGTIYNWKKKLKKRLADEVARLDPNPLVGDTIAFFNEVRGVAMQTASTVADPKVQARFLDVAVRAESSKQATFQAWNVMVARPLSYDAGGYHPAEEAKSMQEMVDAIVRGEGDAKILQSLDFEDAGDGTADLEGFSLVGG